MNENNRKSISNVSFNNFINDILEYQQSNPNKTQRNSQISLPINVDLLERQTSNPIRTQRNSQINLPNDRKQISKDLQPNLDIESLENIMNPLNQKNLIMRNEIRGSILSPIKVITEESEKEKKKSKKCFIF